MLPSPDPAPLSVELISATDELEQLRPAWATLWQRVPSANPFQSPDWLIAWWRHIGQGELLTLAVRTTPDGTLVGLLPLYIHQKQDGRRLLLPLGIATTDYLDALIAPGHEDEVMAGLFHALAGSSTRWDACEWPQLRPGSPLLDAPAPPGWAEERTAADPCPILPLPPTVAELAAVVPRRMLQNLRTARHRAQAAGTLHCERAEATTLEDIFEAQILLHRARWAERGEAGVLASAAVLAAHRAALPGLLHSGLLRLYALRLDGEIIATLYALADAPDRVERRFYFYLGGFDPRFAALSPGTLILGHAVEEAIREGATGFDFLRGRETYKYRWGARDIPTFRRHLRAPPDGAMQ